MKKEDVKVLYSLKVLHRKITVSLLITLISLTLACNRQSRTTQQAPTRATPPIADTSPEVAVTLPFFHRLDDNYVRGGEPKRGGIETLQRMGVKTLVDLRSDYDHTDELGVAAKRSGLHYYRVPLSVWNPPTDAEAKEFISIVKDESQGPFYVFCA